jgi:hypothetical protein
MHIYSSFYYSACAHYLLHGFAELIYVISSHILHISAGVRQHPRDGVSESLRMCAVAMACGVITTGASLQCPRRLQAHIGIAVVVDARVEEASDVAWEALSASRLSSLPSSS